MSLRDAQLEEFQRLWLVEDRSSTELAAFYKVKRATVCSFANRHGLKKSEHAKPDKKKPGAKPREPKPEVAAEANALLDAAQIEEPPDEPEPDVEEAEAFDGAEPASLELFFSSTSVGTSFGALEPHHCRWPIARKDEQHLFCGKPAKDGGWMKGGLPYCTEHALKGLDESSRVSRRLKKECGL